MLPTDLNREAIMARRRIARAVSLVLSLGLAAVSPSPAQSSVAVDAGAATLGDGRDGYSFFETGVRFSSLQPKAISADVRLATVPTALASGVLLLAMDLDAAYVAPLGERLYATPRAGVSLIGGASSDGPGGVPGLNYGIGLVARLDGPLALRIDYSRFLFLVDPSVGASTFSIGIAWVH